MTAGGRGGTDRLLTEVGRRLEAEGAPLTGVVQSNIEFDPARQCHMDLHVLGAGDGAAEGLRISQNLGIAALGCRLDPHGLEAAAGAVAAALATGRPRLLIVNKFGRGEIEGGGFRPVIGQALASGVAVLCGVGAKNAPAFEDFAGGLAETLAPDAEVVLAWCRARLSGPDAAD